MTSDPPCDVVIVGGGPAGTSAALALRARDRSVALVERVPFPRFHIGESLLPFGTTLFERLGIDPAVRAAGFTEKWGVTFVAGDGGREQRYDFARWGASWHVLRSDFDAILLEAARARGARCVSGNVRDVAFDGELATVKLEDGSALRARYVIDASGRAGVIARRFGRRDLEPRLRKAAVYAHFTGVPRAEGRPGGDIVIVSMRDLSWAWVIPLAGGVTSVGIVLDQGDLESVASKDPADLFARLAAKVPALRALLARARATGPTRIESGFCYRARNHAGERWLLAGDAGAFVDPVFSSGVQFAMLGGIDAAECVDAALRDPAHAARALRRFDRRQARRYAFVLRFARAFYRSGLRDLFFAPSPRCGLVEALASVLAGHWQPTPWTRSRLLAMFALARAQPRVAFVPRMHGVPGESIPPAGTSEPPRF